MITDDYNNGPRVVRKDYVLWKIQNMQQSASMPSSYLFLFYLYVNFRKDIDSEEPHVLSTGDITFK